MWGFIMYIFDLLSHSPTSVIMKSNAIDIFFHDQLQDQLNTILHNDKQNFHPDVELVVPTRIPVWPREAI